jgi:hypothetical protein
MSGGIWKFILDWLPIVVFVVIWFVMSKGYGKHMDRVSTINDEILEVTRKSHALMAEQIVILKEIKTLLEDRKS